MPNIENLFLAPAVARTWLRPCRRDMLDNHRAFDALDHGGRKKALSVAGRAPPAHGQGSRVSKGAEPIGRATAIRREGFVRLRGKPIARGLSDLALVGEFKVDCLYAASLIDEQIVRAESIGS